MASETFIKGKDCALETSITSMQAKLQKHDIHIKEASVLNPVPYVHSVHIQDASCNLMFTNGKGASEKSSLASALGEYFERISCNYFFADYYLGEEIGQSAFVHYPNEKWFDASQKEEVLDENLWALYDPENALELENLFDLNSGAGERGVCALPFVRHSDEKEIYFPVNIIGNLYVSNGMAAGNNQDEARVQALSEIFERYVKNKIIAEEICLPEIPEDVLARFPHIVESLNKLEAYGYKLRVCDASLGGEYPVICVTLINPKNASVLASFGAHPSFEVALERTVTELLQGRSIDQVDDFTIPSFSSDEVSDPHNLVEHFINSTGLISYEFFKSSPDYDFVDWEYGADTKQEFISLSEKIEKMGFEIYIADYTHLDVYACRILVPGMSEIYPLEDLLWENNNEGAYFRKYLLSLDTLDEEGLESVLENLEEAEVADETKVAAFMGVAADAGTGWASLQVGTLKCMIALALQDLDKAHEYNLWALHISDLNDEEKKIHHCLAALLEIALDEEKVLSDYLAALTTLYSAELLEKAGDIFEVKEKFHGLHFPGLSLEGFEKHLLLLETYKKLHLSKEKFWTTLTNA